MPKYNLEPFIFDSLSEEQEILLSRFLFQTTPGVVRAGKPCRYIDGDNEYNFTVHNSLLRSKDKDEPSSICYQILAETAEQEGTRGSIGTLQVREDDTIDIKHKRNLGEFKLETLTNDQSIMLNRFLKQTDKDYISGEACAYFENNVEYTFTISHSLLRRKRSGDQTQSRYEILSNTSIGEGAYGEVRESLGTLQVNENFTIDIKRTKRRVVKVEEREVGKLSPDVFKAKIKMEYDLLKITHQLKVKSPVFLGENISYLVMEEVGDTSLSETIRSFNAEDYTFLNLLKWQHQILKDIHYLNYNIIHCDIKPGNMRVESTTGIVKLIDFGSSCYADEPIPTPFGYKAGTVGFMPPELTFSEAPSLNTDAFAISKSLAALWHIGKNDIEKMEEGADVNAFQQAKLEEYKRTVVKDTVYKESERLKQLNNKRDTRTILDILTGMARADINKRISVREALYTTKELLFSHTFNNAIQLNSNDLLKIRGHQIGMAALKEIHLVADIKEQSPTTRWADYQTILTKHFAKVEKPIERSYFFDALDLLPDKDQSLESLCKSINESLVENYFTARLQVHLKNMETFLSKNQDLPADQKLEIVNLIEDLKNECQKQYQPRMLEDFLLMDRNARRKLKNFEDRVVAVENGSIVHFTLRKKITSELHLLKIALLKNIIYEQAKLKALYYNRDLRSAVQKLITVIDIAITDLTNPHINIANYVKLYHDCEARYNDLLEQHEESKSTVYLRVSLNLKEMEHRIALLNKNPQLKEIIDKKDLENKIREAKKLLEPYRDIKKKPAEILTVGSMISSELNYESPESGSLALERSLSKHGSDLLVLLSDRGLNYQDDELGLIRSQIKEQIKHFISMNKSLKKEVVSYLKDILITLNCAITAEKLITNLRLKLSQSSKLEKLNNSIHEVLAAHDDINLVSKRKHSI